MIIANTLNFNVFAISYWMIIANTLNFNVGLEWGKEKTSQCPCVYGKFFRLAEYMQVLGYHFYAFVTVVVG